ncbi:MAG: MFS transporter [Elainella sp.]
MLGNKLAKRNVALLVLCQALAMTSLTMLFTVAALIGARLAADPALATLPVALLQVAVMLTTIPASLYMQRVGRQRGFMLGTLFGLAGAGLGITAVLSSNFLLFCLATVLFGIFNGFSGFYRFAAADAATESFRARAISFVVAGGVIAALLGPNLASWAKDWFTEAEFAGSLLPIVGFQILTLAVLQGVQIPPIPQATVQTGRPLTTLLRHPVFIVATLGSMVGYSVMVLLMTATPLAMTDQPHPGHPFSQAAFVIQWHVLGMFAPSFFTGSLINRFGVLNVILWGIGCNFLSIATNFWGTDVGHFLVALTLLGIGWNWMFVGSTTLLTQMHSPAEKAQIQAAHDFLTFTAVAVAALLSGRLLERYGWLTINWVALPGLAVALVAVLWLRHRLAIRAEQGTP